MDNFYLKVLRRSAYNFAMITGLFVILFGSHYLLTTGLESLGFSFLFGQGVWIAIAIAALTLFHSIMEIRSKEAAKLGSVNED